jgi:shikimate dehydrogenase
VAENGLLRGFNYDAFGFVESLREAAPALRIGASPAVVLGAGGAARAILAGLIGEGAKEIRLANRTFERARQLASEFGPSVQPVEWDEREGALSGAALLVNTTSMGMTGQPPLEIALDGLADTAVVSDIVYAPLETDLLAQARRRGLTCVDGLGMLLHQARPAFRDWFGPMPKVTPELRRKIEASL